MPYKNIIVIALDIDETLMNSKTRPFSLIDFNGSDTYGDASAWTDFLQRIVDHCEDKSIRPIVQIISSKEGANPDDTVDHVAMHLHKFLHVVDKHGEKLLKDFPMQDGCPTHYFLKRHFGPDFTEDKCCINTTLTRTITDDTPVNISGELPPIHLCRNNHPTRTLPSKGLVMKKIREHFAVPIPAENMFLLDNNLDVQEELKEGVDVLYFQGVSSYSLEEHCYGLKEERTVLCKQILSDFETRVMQRVAYIVKSRQTEDVSETSKTAFAFFSAHNKKQTQQNSIEQEGVDVTDEDMALSSNW